MCEYTIHCMSLVSYFLYGTKKSTRNFHGTLECRPRTSGFCETQFHKHWSRLQTNVCKTVFLDSRVQTTVEGLRLRRFKNFTIVERRWLHIEKRDETMQKRQQTQLAQNKPRKRTTLYIRVRFIIIIYFHTTVQVRNVAHSSVIFFLLHYFHVCYVK